LSLGRPRGWWWDPFCPESRTSSNAAGRNNCTYSFASATTAIWRLESGLRVYKIYSGYWFFGRPTVEELRLDLRAVLQRCRPDWDISSAAQRVAWERGDKAGFYPYGKSHAQVLADGD
jgi:hypothetical protein